MNLENILFSNDYDLKISFSFKTLINGLNGTGAFKNSLGQDD